MRAADLVAVHDAPGDGVGAAEQARGMFESPAASASRTAELETRSPPKSTVCMASTLKPMLLPGLLQHGEDRPRAPCRSGSRRR
jgi:hypothetical protein